MTCFRAFWLAASFLVPAIGSLAETPQTFSRADFRSTVFVFAYDQSVFPERHYDFSKIAGSIDLTPDGVKPIKQGYFQVTRSADHFSRMTASESEQHGVIRYSGHCDTVPAGYTAFEMYITEYVLLDTSGQHDPDNDLLTVWAPVGKDSLRFVCAQDSIFNCGVSQARVIGVSNFPDNSFLLAVEIIGREHQEVAFYRGKNLCRFERFHTLEAVTAGPQGPYEWISVNIDSVCQNSWKASVSRKFFSSPIAEGPAANVPADSTSYAILELWRIALESEEAKTDDSATEQR